ncbi:hypothetical protein LSTR_LSTR008271 [Laodelphax striatellus]|uniref:Uncharacterized protein n=1 Tax=Laodelphax striatellus TaxID=195883 RepID=A0A482XN01_LAOST|nr:hypothetical protein LSTR_LSTR008271 [Laodelphax striatellus]
MRPRSSTMGFAANPGIYCQLVASTKKLNETHSNGLCLRNLFYSAQWLSWEAAQLHKITLCSADDATNTSIIQNIIDYVLAYSIHSEDLLVRIFQILISI